MTRARHHWVLPASLLAALALSLLPVPQLLLALRPYWLGLVLAYWVIEDPDRVGLGFAFIVGLAGDLVSDGLLGEQALRLVVMAFILQRFRARLRFFPLSQQALAVGGLMLNDRIVTAAIHMVLREPPLPSLFWLSPLTGMALWPVIFLLLDALRLGSWRRR
ncbi:MULTISPECIES: rod shape-determining protein MreD [Lysobacter]|jgi:rod shape-determining protein MreD|uniref:Rod shape-determining protein MreD n=1 Tax=Lysobacter gummosus TaxID=262324 RepID=A0ABY3X8E7_9GAMM|nr:MULTISPECIES: rod shape-determining protein MreD [Lysobacter]ALN93395.1 rod shape-determining protein MreD [Lysobacter gummosus]MBT2749299.1 rod shape-determining protein MreD [Lysobacter sp. ISL-42]MBT2754324.1 rod shape-determining protein MreD [Lysobacter sp. ISL-50]MBT2777196.1 rod shape-determining protein MreD [Lysobacter sp. ISL-54]MBT2780179.1 rod shape-determining protein MreD [Lysobacter sp. ISL-52]